MVKRIVDLLRQHPEGLTAGEIRAKLDIAADKQSQLDRRRREVRDWYELIVIPNGGNPKYILGPKLADCGGPSGINGRIRAEVLRLARGRCQMCGRTIADDEIKLQIDHKVPQDWGGTNDLENLWALCVNCNHGKKNLFASQDEKVKAVLKHESVHMRIGELLKLSFGDWVSAQMIEFVANQDDWKKRTRDLRYLGWKIGVTKRKEAGGRVRSLYRLTKFEEWPPDPTKWIRDFERDRAIANKLKDAEDDDDDD